MIVRRSRVPALLLLSTLLYVSSVADAQAIALHNGLVGYWKLDDNGVSAIDSAGANHGEVRNAPEWLSGGDGKFGAGVKFNGSSQGILIPSSETLNIGTTGVTVSAWVKLGKLPNDPTNPAFSGVYDADADSYVLYVDRSANELRFKATTANGQSSSAHPGVPAAMLDTTSWHHVMGTFDGSAGNGASRIYLDGNLIDISSVNTTAGGLVKPGQIAGIGAQPGTGAGNPLGSFFSGSVADVAVWNRTLGAAEAQYLFNGGVGNAVGAANPNIAPFALTPVQPTAQPVIRYSFDGNLANSGTGGAAYNAVLHRKPGSSASPNYAATGLGQGLDLRGNLPAAGTAGVAANDANKDPNGDYLSVDYALTDAGTIELRFTADRFFDFQTLWSNSAHGNAWESWIYNDGRLSARAHNSASANDLDFYLPIVGGSDPAKDTYHIAYTWERNGAQLNSKLYVDGVLREQTAGSWLNPGATFFIGGGGWFAASQNHLGSGVYDEFRIYDVALTDGEVLFRSQAIPEPMSLALTGFGVALLSCFRARRSPSTR